MSGRQTDSLTVLTKDPTKVLHWAHQTVDSLVRRMASPKDPRKGTKLASPWARQLVYETEKHWVS